MAVGGMAAFGAKSPVPALSRKAAKHRAPQ